MTASIQDIAIMVRDAELLDADGCAFLLSLTTRKGEINRRTFLERIANTGGFPKPLTIGGQKRWRRADVKRWIDDQVAARDRE